MTSAVSGSPSRSARRRPSVSVWSDGSETIPPSCSTRPRITTDSPPPAGRSRGHHPDLAKDLHGPLDPGGAPVSKDLDLLVAADRKSTRLNSSHITISYAVFCLKKKK